MTRICPKPRTLNPKPQPFPQVMTRICREAEASLDYYALFKNILKQVGGWVCGGLGRLGRLQMRQRTQGHTAL